MHDESYLERHHWTRVWPCGTPGELNFFYNYTNIAFAPYGKHWRQMWTICTLELLSAKRMETFESIREEVKNPIASISLNQGLPINFSEKICALTTVITCRTAFGNKRKYQDEFIATMKEVSKLAEGLDLPDIFPSLSFFVWLPGWSLHLEGMHEKVDKILDEQKVFSPISNQRKKGIGFAFKKKGRTNRPNQKKSFQGFSGDSISPHLNTKRKLQDEVHN